jgi:hypothetical protein
MFPRAEGGRVSRKDQQDAARCLDALNSHQISSAIIKSEIRQKRCRASNLSIGGIVGPEIPRYCDSAANAWDAALVASVRRLEAF